MTTKKEQIIALLRKGKSVQDIVDEVGCSNSSVYLARRDLDGTALVVVDAEVDEGGAPKPTGLRARVTELEEENDGLRTRVVELLEHVAELSTEHMRLARVLRAQQEA